MTFRRTDIGGETTLDNPSEAKCLLCETSLGKLTQYQMGVSVVKLFTRQISNPAARVRLPPGVVTNKIKGKKEAKTT